MILPANPKLPVSVCILVLNEADRLNQCLSNLELFSELIVLDSGSTDSSIEIAKRYGARVFQGEWLGFGRMRQKLFSLASQPWIFWLDADEIVSPGLKAELAAVFSSNIQCDAFKVNRMVHFNGRFVRHGDWFPDWNTRIFRRDRWSMDPAEVHEKVKISGTTLRLSSVLYHYTYRNWDDSDSRSRRYAELWARQEADRGRRTGRLEGSSRAIWRFFKGYLLKFGFLDGRLGFKIALSNAREVQLKYRLLRRLNDGMLPKKSHRTEGRQISPGANPGSDD